MVMIPRREISWIPLLLRYCRVGSVQRNLGSLIIQRCMGQKQWLRQRNQRNLHSPSEIEDDRWVLQLDIGRAEDKPNACASLLALMYFYYPLKLLADKISILKLKLLWDIHFSEAKFIENSKQAAVVITDIIRQQDPIEVRNATTPMGFKQIHHDMFGENIDFRFSLMRFQRQHIRRAIPIKVHRLRHYNHKFAYIDMVFVGIRSLEEQEQLETDSSQSEMLDHQKSADTEHMVYAEFFVRFRRDYSENPRKDDKEADMGANEWLVSSYKIMQFAVLDKPEDY